MSSSSGILLESDVHVRGHPQYNAAIIAELKDINLSMSPVEVARAVQRVVDDWRRKINSREDGPWQ